jgi:serine/threonine protein kinase
MPVDSDRPSPLDQGYRIDRYELLYALAQGGMGSVWVARLQGKHGFEKLFAIKTILPRHASDPHFRSMFLDEARVASAIVHPNVSQILDLGEHQGILYLVMEWVEGDSLDRLIRNAEKSGTKLPPGLVLRIIAETCLGLHAAHELADREGKSFEVVHRDISPQNVLVGLNGCPKLIDFGVAKARDRVSGETTGVVVKGKVRYISPQQALGIPVDRRADIWSMGAILYMAFAGDTPYPGATEVAILRGLLSGAPPAALPATIPKPISRVIEKCLQHGLAARYQTALELNRAIEEAMIEADTPCSIAEVAAYMREHTQHRVERRRRALETALENISGRLHYVPLIIPPNLGIPGNLGIPANKEETQAEYSMIPVDLATYPEKEVTFRAQASLGRLVMIAIGASALGAAIVLLITHPRGDPKSALLAQTAVSAEASTAVPFIAPPEVSSVPTVVVNSEQPEPRRHPPRRAPAPQQPQQEDIPPANSGLGSAIDSRK